MDRHGQRLDQGADTGLEPIRDGDEAGGRPRDEVAQGAIDRTVASKPDIHAQVCRVGPARLAHPARNRGIHGHATALLIPRGDDTGELVTEYERAVEDGVTDPAVGQPVAIRPAQADFGDPDENLAWAWIRDRFVVEPELATGMEPKDEHAAYCGASTASSGRVGIQTRIASTERFAHVK
jgi:hypothetical protein